MRCFIAVTRSGLMRVPHDWTRAVDLGEEHHKGEVPSTSNWGGRGVRHVNMICDDANLDRLFKVVSGRFLHCRATIFPLQSSIC